MAPSFSCGIELGSTRAVRISAADAGSFSGYCAFFSHFRFDYEQSELINLKPHPIFITVMFLACVRE